MISQEEKNKLFAELTEVREEVKLLKFKLNEINNLKEKWFDKKEELNSKISGLIGNVKHSKSERDSLTGKVKEHKAKRSEYNKEILRRKSRVQSLNKEKKIIMSKHNIKGDPSQIKKEINKLESKIETEVMSFDKEKSMMMEIKLLRKRFEESKKISSVWENINAISKEINELKKKSDNAHRIVQDQAKKSQESHEEIIATSGDVKGIREEEKQAFEKFIEYKKQFGEVNTTLKLRLAKLNDLNSKLTDIKEEGKKKKKAKEVETMKVKKEDVEEKIKTKKKLTTADLLVFQRDE